MSSSNIRVSRTHTWGVGSLHPHRIITDADGNIESYVFWEVDDIRICQRFVTRELADKIEIARGYNGL